MVRQNKKLNQIIFKKNRITRKEEIKKNKQRNLIYKFFFLLISNEKRKWNHTQKKMSENFETTTRLN